MNMSEIKAIKYWVMIESYSYNTIKALTAIQNLENKIILTVNTWDFLILYQICILQ